jgi:hypothetical protein
MDPYDGGVLRNSFDPVWMEPLRRNMGYTLRFAERMDLIHMLPEPALASSSYCLANQGTAYLVYLPEGRDVVLDLTGSAGPFQVEWFNPDTGEFKKSGIVKGGEQLSFTSPFGDVDAVLYLDLE